jgi:hypothetical protein
MEGTKFICRMPWKSGRDGVSLKRFIRSSHRNSALYGNSLMPNNSFNRSANSVAFTDNLNLLTLTTRPVNSGVRLLLVFSGCILRQ